MNRALLFYLIFVFTGLFVLICHGEGSAFEAKTTVYNRTGNNISHKFKKFMKCNAGKVPECFCKSNFGWKQFMFDNETANSLRQYHFIFIPGGEFDAVSELLKYCSDNEIPPDLQEFFKKNPTIYEDIAKFLNENVCPYDHLISNYYERYLGAFKSYEDFFNQYAISYTKLDFFWEQTPSYVGDRIGKLDLIADTIESIEEKNSSSEVQEKINYILIGHSFGGLNITDFLVELAEGHSSNTPEGKIFEQTKVRQWKTEEKERIFNKIKGVILLNSFIQGDQGSETKLIKKAEEEGISASDPVEYYIQYILNNYFGEQTSDNPVSEEILHLVLRSARYRLNYYLKDQNTFTGANEINVQKAFNKIAGNIAVISVGCIVPKIFPSFRVGRNIMVHESGNKWDQERAPNDGMVSTYAGLFPSHISDYIIMNKMDHGTIVLKPDVAWVTSGWEYDQIPFIKTLLKRLESRLKDMTDKKNTR
jgi:hypothetical protein